MTTKLPIDALHMPDPFWDPQHPLRLIQERFCAGGELVAADVGVLNKFLHDTDIRINNLAHALLYICQGQPEKLQFALSICAERERRKIAAPPPAAVLPSQAKRDLPGIPTYAELKGRIPTYRVEKQRVVRNLPEL